MKVERLTVKLNFTGVGIDVGELVQSGRNIYFKYYDAFLNLGLNISPIKLPFTNEIHQADQNLFSGLYGVFHDSLPDSWGRLLLDRKLIGMGLDPPKIGALERLSFIGVNGMGALEYVPVIETQLNDLLDFNLDEIYTETTRLISGSDSEVLDELFAMGGTSGGARPKINVWVNTANKHIVPDAMLISKEDEPWIIKFPASVDITDSANIEYAYSLMAKDAGIEMEECKLFQGKSGRYYFGTKRFDRNMEEKLHLHSASGLMHDDHRYSQMDYGHLMDCAFYLERSVVAYEKVLRLAAFNVFSHNRDDHSKNFSFLMDKMGVWKFSPAYDLTYSSSSHGYHSTLVAGESLNPGTQNLMELAREFGVKNAKHIIDEVKTTVAQWKKFARESGVSDVSEKLIQKTIQRLVVN